MSVAAAVPQFAPQSDVSAGALTAVLKRTFDIVLALTGLALTLPVFGLIALLIKLDSNGSVFFRQVRVGLNRRTFRMWKFRKMMDNLPARGPSVTRWGDPRLTRVGRILERTKLDELPQLINVLAGHMSIVGPRPEVPKFVAHYPERWEKVLTVRPGIFGPNQIRNRNEAELFPADCTDVEAFYVNHILPEKLAVDADYAARPSVRADCLLLIGGLSATLFGCRWK